MPSYTKGASQFLEESRNSHRFTFDASAISCSEDKIYFRKKNAPKAKFLRADAVEAELKVFQLTESARGCQL